MFGYYLSKWFGLSQHPTILGAVVITLLTMIMCGCVGFVIERLAYRPLRKQPRINSLITAIGVSFLLEYGGQVVFHPEPRAFSVIPIPASGSTWTVAGIQIGYIDLVIIATSLVLMFVLQRIVFHTRMGTAMRAVSWNPGVAALMGVNTDMVISFTFVLGSVLAAVAGILHASKYSGVQPLMGLMPGLKAFVAAVLGGIGNVPGAMLGGLLLGLAEQLVSAYVSSSWRDACSFGILILVLLMRPSGLLGKGTVEKV
jgi:branched-chain amino acid transport system permease protein